MGWQGDHLMPHTGTWVVTSAGGMDLGVIAIWWSNNNGPGEAHVLRVHPVPLPDNCKIELDPTLGVPPGGAPLQRRIWFKQACWPAYKQKYTQPGPNWKAREWHGGVTDITNLLNAPATPLPPGDIQ